MLFRSPLRDFGSNQARLPESGTPGDAFDLTSFWPEFPRGWDGGGCEERITELPGATNRRSGFAVDNFDTVRAHARDRSLPQNETYGFMEEDPLRGFTLESGAGQDDDTPIHMGFAGETRRRDERAQLASCEGIDTLGEYRDMLVRDFNTQGVVDTYAGDTKTREGRKQAGMDPFVDAVVGRFYPDRDKADPHAVAICEILAQNLWSYATTGMDQGGKTDTRPSSRPSTCSGRCCPGCRRTS